MVAARPGMRKVEAVMDHRPSLELLESTHFFPGVYQIKAIGSTDGEIARRLVVAGVSVLAPPSALDLSVRTTPGGRHVAVTLDITVQNAEQVRRIYARIHELKGL